MTSTFYLAVTSLGTKPQKMISQFMRFFAKASSSEYVNVSRWYNHIEALLRFSGVSREGSGVIVEGSAPIIEAIAIPPAADTDKFNSQITSILIPLLVPLFHRFSIINS